MFILPTGFFAYLFLIIRPSYIDKDTPFRESIEAGFVIFEAITSDKNAIDHKIEEPENAIRQIADFNKNKKAFETEHKSRDIFTLLMIASLDGDLESVKRLLEQNVDVNAVSNNGVTALMLASQKGNEKIVDILLKHNADVNKRWGNLNPLMVAAFMGHIQTVKVLLKYNVDINAEFESNVTAFMHAVLQNQTEIVELFLQHSKINTNHQIDKTTLSRSLVVASGYGFAKIVNQLLSFTSDTKAIADGIQIAMAKNHYSVLDVFFKHYDINSIKLNQDVPLLYFQAAIGKEKMVEYLLKKNADVNAALNTFTPLKITSLYGKVNIVKILLKYNADVNHFKKTSQTALFYAIAQGHKEIVELLLQHNADINILYEDSFTALLLAQYLENKEIENLLLTYGADHTLKRNFYHLDFLFTYGLLLSILLSITTHLAEIFCKPLNISKEKIEKDLHSMIFYYSELFYTMTKAPLYLQNVWGCDKTCQPNESGFFRLLNFRGKLHSSTHVQDVSPNCYGCLVTKEQQKETVDSKQVILECLLLLNYIRLIAECTYGEHLAKQYDLTTDVAESYIVVYNYIMELYAVLNFNIIVVRYSQLYDFQKQLEKLKWKIMFFRNKMQSLQKNKKNKKMRTTEPKLLCSMFGLNELFEIYLLELDMESINHQTLVYFLNRWLENTVQAIEETDRSISLYECMLRIGLSEEKATTYIGYLCEEFINMYSSLYWLSRYFENLCLMNPLITEIPKTCLFEGDFNVWKSGQVQRVNNDQNFELKFLNQKSPMRFNNKDINTTCDRVSRYLKKQKDKDSLFLFHGTSLLSAVNILERGINLVKGKQNLDFSHAKGFYVINNLRKSVEWSCTHKPELHAVVIFKLKKMEMDNGNGLVLHDEREWGEVVTACRKGFENDNGPDVEDRLQNVDFVRGFICANGREVHRNNHHPVIMEERDGYRPLQTCILNKDYARWFGSPANIFGLVVFRNG